MLVRQSPTSRSNRSTRPCSTCSTLSQLIAPPPSARCHDMEERAAVPWHSPGLRQAEGVVRRERGVVATAVDRDGAATKVEKETSWYKHFVGGGFADLPAEAFATNGAPFGNRSKKAPTTTRTFQKAAETAAEKEAEPETPRVVFANAYGLVQRLPSVSE